MGSSITNKTYHNSELINQPNEGERKPCTMLTQYDTIQYNTTQEDERTISTVATVSTSPNLSDALQLFACVRVVGAL